MMSETLLTKGFFFNSNMEMAPELLKENQTPNSQMGIALLQNCYKCPLANSLSNT